jgi:Fe2+ or Zn2+ uptake regulation protein
MILGIFFYFCNHYNITIMESFREHLKKHGINPSVQRLVIYDYLYKNHNHPTVDNIYSSLSPSMPTLSKTTVYNTLKLFVDKGVAIIVNIDEHEARYDADISMHGHFKCKGCGSFFDVQLTKPEINSLEGFRIDSYQINMKGYCRICSSLKNQGGYLR